MKTLIAFLAVLLLFAAVAVLPYVVHLVGFFLPMVVGNWPDPM